MREDKKTHQVGPILHQDSNSEASDLYNFNHVCPISAKLCDKVFHIMFDIYGKKRNALNFESKSTEATHIHDFILVAYHQSKPFKQYSPKPSK